MSNEQKLIFDTLYAKYKKIALSKKENRPKTASIFFNITRDVRRHNFIILPMQRNFLACHICTRRRCIVS